MKRFALFLAAVMVAFIALAACEEDPTGDNGNGTEQVDGGNGGQTGDNGGQTGDGGNGQTGDNGGQGGEGGQPGDEGQGGEGQGGNGDQPGGNEGQGGNDQPGGDELLGVDLGLSVRWADHNVGATTPEEAGDYYGWGETQTHTDYCWDNYSWATRMMMTKYNTSDGYGSVIDNLTTLEADDDVATVKMGGGWRMPTRAELTELMNGCNWTWVDEKKGYTVASKTNSNSIFLPAAGMQNGTRPQDVGNSGMYWSSSLDTGSPNSAYRILLYSTVVFPGSDSRYYGASVRAVAKPIEK